MKRTSPSASWDRMEARSPARSSAGPEVTWRATSISVATMPGQGGLAQARRAGEEQVVGGLAPAAGGLEDDGQVLLELGLAHEVVEGAGPQAGLGRLLAAQRVGVEQARRAPGPASARQVDSSLIGRPPSGAGPRSPGRRRVAVGQVAGGLGDLLGAVAEGGQRVAHVGPDRAGDAVGRRSPSAAAPRAHVAGGTSRRVLSSISRRAAVFLPTPGTRHRAATSSSARTRARAMGAWTERMARASAGPTPWAPRRGPRTRRARRGWRSRRAMGVLADVVVGPDEDLGPDVAQAGRGGRAGLRPGSRRRPPRPGSRRRRRARAACPAASRSSRTSHLVALDRARARQAATRPAPGRGPGGTGPGRRHRRHRPGGGGGQPEEGAGPCGRPGPCRRRRRRRRPA